MKTITLVNEKGGVGKTTIAGHLAAGLAAKGKRVMLIDGDPQGHASIRAGVKKGPGLYDLMVREAEWKNVVKLVPPEKYSVPGERISSGTLWVLPSNVETRNIANSISDADSFAMRLDEISGMVDYCIIDTSPTPSLLHGAFYTATDAIIYPTMLAFTSFDGLAESIKRRQVADKVRESRWGLAPIELMGIVPVAYRSVTSEQKHNLMELRKTFGKAVWTPIAQAVIWQETESRALPVWQLEPSHPATKQAWAMVERVMGHASQTTRV